MMIKLYRNVGAMFFGYLSLQRVKCDKIDDMKTMTGDEMCVHVKKNELYGNLAIDIYAKRLHEKCSCEIVDIMRKKNINKKNIENLTSKNIYAKIHADGNNVINVLENLFDKNNKYDAYDYLVVLQLLEKEKLMNSEYYLVREFFAKTLLLLLEDGNKYYIYTFLNKLKQHKVSIDRYIIKNCSYDFFRYLGRSYNLFNIFCSANKICYEKHIFSLWIKQEFTKDVDCLFLELFDYDDNFLQCAKSVYGNDKNNKINLMEEVLREKNIKGHKHEAF